MEYSIKIERRCFLVANVYSKVDLILQATKGKIRYGIFQKKMEEEILGNGSISRVFSFKRKLEAIRENGILQSTGIYLQITKYYGYSIENLAEVQLTKRPTDWFSRQPRRGRSHAA